MYNNFNVQISDDSTFSTISEASTGNLSAYAVTGLEKNTDYFWRVNAVLGSHTGPWSVVWKFSLTDSTTTDAEFETTLPYTYSLAQNFPNPFQHSTRIFYTIQESNFVTLKIYDQTGREIQTLINKTQDRGSYSVNFDAQGLSGAIYFYTIQAGKEFIETKKMVLIGD
jgi:hypothetical protein